MRNLALLSIAVIAIVFTQTSIAEESEALVDATDPEGLVSVFQDLGYRAKLDVDSAGDPIIYSSVGGTDYALQFFGCSKETNDQCTLLLFKVGYDLTDGTTIETVNTWNHDNVVGQAHLDDENDPWLSWAVNMHGGVSRENFDDSIDWWEVIVSDFESHIDY